MENAVAAQVLIFIAAVVFTAIIYRFVWKHSRPRSKIGAVLRVYEQGRPKFQLRKGEVGLSVFDADWVCAEDILPNFMPGSRVTKQDRQIIESLGLQLRKTPGDSELPPILRDNHFEISPGFEMSRNEFKLALRKLELIAEES